MADGAHDHPQYEDAIAVLRSGLTDAVSSIADLAAQVAALKGNTPAEVPPPPPPPPPPSVSSWPDGSNTGIGGLGLSAADLTPYKGPRTIPAGTYERMLFTGSFVAGKGTQQFTGCMFVTTGYPGVSNWPDEGGRSSGAVFEDCSFDGTQAGQGSGAIQGNNLTVRRCNIWGYDNGGTSGNDCLVEDSYIHDLGFRGSADGSGSHPDGWEHNGGNQNCTMRHNRIIADSSPFTTSGVMCGTAGGASINNYRLENNWITVVHDGFSIYLHAKNGGRITGVSVVDNIFEWKPGGYGPVYFAGPVSIDAWSGNVDGAGNPIGQPG